MKETGAAPSAARRRAPVVAALTVTLLEQTLSSMAMIVPAVLAPVAARDLGVAPQSVGVVVSGTYLFAMTTGLVAGPLIARFGALRLCELTVVMTALGLAVGGGGTLAVVPIAVVLIGGAYGMVNPVSSHILAQAAPRRRMSLIFSIKQTGVPIGGAIAGALVPTLLLLLGWKWTLVLLGAVCGVVAALMRWAHGRRAGPAEGGDKPLLAVLHGAVRGIAAPVKLALSAPTLRELAFVSLVYAQVQLVAVTYLVSYLNLELGFSLVVAGLIYSTAQIAGIVGRIGWGAVADHLLPPRRTLGVIGLIAAVGGVSVSLFAPSWPLAAMIAVCGLYGACAIGWNGVFLAEVARRAPAGQIGTATGGVQFFTFFGALTGPPLFALVVSLSGGYAVGFALFAVPALVVGLRLLWRARQ